MESTTRYLRPIILDVQPTSPEAPRIFKHWKFVLTQYVAAIPEGSRSQSLGVLASSLSPNNYELIADYSTYESALDALASIFVKPPSAVIARHTLMSRKQLSQESVEEYSRELQRLSIDCQFQAVTSSTYRDEYIRDSFIAGLKSPLIRTRLLEHHILPLNTAIDKARALELAQRESRTYDSPGHLAAVQSSPKDLPAELNEEAAASTTTITSLQGNRLCYFCGRKPSHDRSTCPARNSTCSKCRKKGHFARVCRSSSLRPETTSTAVSTSEFLFAASNTTFPLKLHSSSLNISINDTQIRALVDTGSTENFVSPDLVSRLGLPTTPYVGLITMAAASSTSAVNSRLLNLSIFLPRIIFIPSHSNLPSLASFSLLLR